MTNEQKREYIAALLREREGAERYGRDGTVAEIDTELARIGHRARSPQQRAETMAAPPRAPVDMKPATPAETPPNPSPQPATQAAAPKRGPGRPRKNS